MSSYEPDLFLQNLLLFPRLLRRAGLPVSPEQSLELAQALTWVDVGDREQVHHTARAVLVRRQEHLALFTVLFNRFWLAARGEVWSRPQTMPRAPRHKTDTQMPPLMTLMAQKAGQQDKEQDFGDRSGTYSPAELIQTKAFSQMTEEELANVKKLIQEMRWQVAQRLTRRRIPDRPGILQARL